MISSEENPEIPESAPTAGAARREMQKGDLLARLTLGLILVYFVGIFLATTGMRCIGERFWPFALLLYFPQSMLLLPLIVLAPAALLAEVPAWGWALLALSLIIILWDGVPATGFQYHSESPPLRVITNNYGQNHGFTLLPFVEKEAPDIVGVQETAGLFRWFQGAFRGWSVQGAGQFILVSRRPISQAVTLPQPAWLGVPVAARFETAWAGGAVAVYLVHMPSPRRDLAKLRGEGLAREAVGDNRRRSDNMSFEEAMEARVLLARSLAARLAEEREPYLVMGDFNMPANGYIRGIFAGKMTDCFAARGLGFGYTFPGDARNPLALMQPWLRLDYIFAGPGWRVEACEVEPDRRSQHRAVAARLSRE